MKGLTRDFIFTPLVDDATEELPEFRLKSATVKEQLLLNNTLVHGEATTDTIEELDRMILGWRNFYDSNDHEIDFSEENKELIPLDLWKQILLAVLKGAQLNEDDIKN